ncbi:MAG: general stress protein [Gammaproteobacteria bacterium]|nr:MAG: general stress protein [Gammaproteobacteria bacterium]
MSEALDNSIKNLRAKIKSIRFAMLTTQNDEQSLSSRPMTQQQLDDNGILWFFVSDESQVAKDIIRQPKINVTFAEPADSIYVAISGNAEVLKYREKAVELWNPAVAAWFPEGVDDPHLSLIKFTIHTAEYWDSHTNKMLQLFAIAKAAISGHPPTDIAEHEKLDLT